MRMNGDQEGRARKLVAVLWGFVAPAFPGALCAALCRCGVSIMQLPVELQNKIINFLVSLPNIHDGDTQRALIYQAGIDSQLQAQISFGKPPAQFVPSLVSLLLSYGKGEDGRYVLETVLEAAKYYVGYDRKLYCDRLLEELHASMAEETRVNENTRSSSSERKQGTQQKVIGDHNIFSNTGNVTITYTHEKE